MEQKTNIESHFTGTSSPKTKQDLMKDINRKHLPFVDRAHWAVLPQCHQILKSSK